VSWGSRSYGCYPGNEIGLGTLNSNSGVDSHLALENCGGNTQGSTIVNDGAWHHVVGVWYGSNMATLYVDGVQQTDVSPQPLPPIYIISSGHLNIGRLVESVGSDNFTGLVDEVQIFNRPLSASEIQAMFHAGTAGLCRYAAQVQPPINSDGTSVFAVRRGVVPVKFTLTNNGSATCTLPPATIAVTRTAGGTIGSINESVYSMSADSGSNFRIDSCQYVYNLNSGRLEWARTRLTS
jgi:concanavalin A-like lectin/glucanase superfamily protein